MNNDESLQGKLKLFSFENYRVSLAELIIPAAEVRANFSCFQRGFQESNMKFMMAGAITPRNP